MNWKITEFLEPLWTSPEAFLAKHRSEFSDYRSFSSSLFSFTDFLKSKLTAIIHDDYTEFVSISNQLIQVGSTINNLINTLETTENSLDKSSLRLREQMQSIKPQTDKLYDIRHEKDACLVALDIINKMENVEKQLVDCDDEIECFLDIAIGLSYVKVKMDGLEPAEKRVLLCEYEKMWNEFCKKIQERIIEVIKKKENDNLLILLNAVVLTGIQDLVYNLFFSCFLKDLFDKINGVKQKVNGRLIFQIILDYLKNANNELLYVINETPETFDFAYYSFWKTISALLDSNVSFPIGDLNEQFDCYKKVKEFFNILESLCKTKENILKIRNDQYSKNLIKKLRLDIYGQLISNQIYLKAEEIFQKPVTKISNEFSLSISPIFLTFYKDIFNDDKFVIEQSKDFAIIAMRLIASLNKYAISSSKQIQTSFIYDLHLMKDYLMESTPIHLRKTLSIPIESLELTSQKIKDNIIQELTQACVNNIKYISQMNGTSVQNSPLKPSSNVTKALLPYFYWAKSEGVNIASNEILSHIINELFNNFYNLSNTLLTSIRNDLEKLIVFRKRKSPNADVDKSSINLFNIEGIKSKLKVDVEYIANIARGKQIEVDSMNIYLQIQELLKPETS